MLVKNAQIGTQVSDIRLSDVIELIGQDLSIAGNEEVIDAQGADVIPGLLTQ